MLLQTGLVVNRLVVRVYLCAVVAFQQDTGLHNSVQNSSTAIRVVWGRNTTIFTANMRNHNL